LGLGDSLENINTTTLDDGAFCYVTAAHQHFELHRDSTAVPDGVTVIAPIAGPGRWVEVTGVGAQGAQGFQGSQGFQGATGSGAQGTTGAQGNQGSQGFQGSVGSGAQGNQGTTGAQGNQGFQGTTGTTGAQGNQGLQGSQGNQGSQGSQGAQGSQASSAPFRGTYYVNPLFVGTQTGSSSNPFTTVAAAFAFAAGQGLVNGVIYLPPGVTVTENITFPTGGGSWDITALEAFGTFSTTLTGTVDLSNTGAASSGLTEFSLNNLDIENNVSGVFSGGPGAFAYCRINNTFVNGTVTLTTTGAGGLWAAEVFGPGGGEDGITGALAVTGFLLGVRADLQGPVSFSATTNFDNCTLSGGSITSHGAGAVGVGIRDCTINALTAFTAASGSMSVGVDGVSARGFLTTGATAGANVSFSTALGNAPAHLVIANNLAGGGLGQQYPAGLVVVEACQTLLAAGTNGSAVINVTYTDLTGTLVTEAVTTALNITSAVGTKARGTLPIQQNGATAPTWSVTGIVTPGALSLAVAINARQAN
jgi:hypothetical protein